MPAKMNAQVVNDTCRQYEDNMVFAYIKKNLTNYQKL